MKRGPSLLLAVLLAGASHGARAHSPIAGVSDFHGGMLHPVLVPAHLIALIAVGLWLNQHGPASGRALLAMLLAVPVGMGLGAITGWQAAEAGILALAAVAAIAVGVARDVPWPWRASLAAVTGGLLGIDSLPDGLSGRALWMSLVGTWFAVLLALCLMATVSEVAVRPWMKIGLRVVASWLAAAAILVLTLSAAGPGPNVPAAAGLEASSARSGSAR